MNKSKIFIGIGILGIAYWYYNKNKVSSAESKPPIDTTQEQAKPTKPRRTPRPNERTIG